MNVSFRIQSLAVDKLHLQASAVDQLAKAHQFLPGRSQQHALLHLPERFLSEALLLRSRMTYLL